MSDSLILIIIGVVLIVFGLAKQSGGFKLSNFGINFGSTNTQTISVAGSPAEASQKPKRDWVAFASKAIGLATAVVGLLKALSGK